MARDYQQVLAATAAAVDKSYVVKGTALKIGRRYVGKVRDVYTAGDFIAIVTTDRMSAFDRLLACVPFKGQVLNMTSAWWFKNTEHIVPNHLVTTPHPNVAIVKKCTAFKVEFVVRAYLTGSTSTSIWMHYKDGVRSYCGHKLPDGMSKNQPLPYVMVTPTTKEDVHDRPITPAEIVAEGLMSQADWDAVSDKALALFKFGQEQAASRGLILVDTKYEFGKDPKTGEVTLIDEIHTPDSSRYWLKDSYEARLAAGQEPDNIDKEFLRIWFRKNCDPYADARLPDAPKDLVAELSKRYIQLYETITGEAFAFPPMSGTNIQDEILAAIAPYFKPAPATLNIFFRPDTDSQEAAFDRALNPSYGAEFPVATAVAVENYPADIVAAPVAVLAAIDSVKAAAGKQFVAVIGGQHSDTLASMVEKQLGLPVVHVGSASACVPTVSAATAVAASQVFQGL